MTYWCFCTYCPLQASRNGAAGVELDLSFTVDGIPVLMHDETVDRTTNGSGPISKLPFAQLRRLDAAAHHRLKYAACLTEREYVVLIQEILHFQSVTFISQKTSSCGNLLMILIPITFDGVFLPKGSSVHI